MGSTHDKMSAVVGRRDSEAGDNIRWQNMEAMDRGLRVVGLKKVLYLTPLFAVMINYTRKELNYQRIAKVL